MEQYIIFIYVKRCLPFISLKSDLDNHSFQVCYIIFWNAKKLKKNFLQDKTLLAIYKLSINFIHFNNVRILEIVNLLTILNKSLMKKKKEKHEYESKFFLYVIRFNQWLSLDRSAVNSETEITLVNSLTN